VTTPEHEIADVRARAERVHARADVDAALDRIAAQITTDFAHDDPILLAVLVGGMYPAVELARRLAFPFRMDCVHATRYQGGLAGGTIAWRTAPRLDLAQRNVVVVDDILDEGHTLQAVVEECRRRGAARVASAVLVRKRHARPAVGHADYCGLDVDDRYVFGCGMDYKEYFRGLPEIWAVP
jgi:hypoxanthine phosphoribosyltransferase